MQITTIPLTQNRLAIVSPEDFDYLSQFKWHLHSKGYAARNIRVQGNWRKRKNILMHRVILERRGVSFGGGLETDHINGDKLDNRFSNLRAVTQAQNEVNQGVSSANKSGFKGVSWDEGHGKWRVGIGVARKYKYLGLFDDIIEAAKVYNEAASRYFGKFAKLNEI